MTDLQAAEREARQLSEIYDSTEEGAEEIFRRAMELEETIGSTPAKSLADVAVQVRLGLAALENYDPDCDGYRALQRALAYLEAR